MRAVKAGTPLLPSEKYLLFLLNAVLCDFFLDVFAAAGNFFFFSSGILWIFFFSSMTQYFWVESLKRSLFFPPICQAPFLISSLKLFFHLCPSISMFILPTYQLTSGNTVMAASDTGENNFNFENFCLVFLLPFFLSFFLVFLHWQQLLTELGSTMSWKWHLCRGITLPKTSHLV